MLKELIIGRTNHKEVKKHLGAGRTDRDSAGMWGWFFCVWHTVASNNNTNSVGSPKVQMNIFLCTCSGMWPCRYNIKPEEHEQTEHTFFSGLVWGRVLTSFLCLVLDNIISYISRLWARSDHPDTVLDLINGLNGSQIPNCFGKSSQRDIS